MPQLRRNRETSRLNFEGRSLQISKTARGRLERLRDETDADSLSEVVRRSLAVYDALVKQVLEGGEVIVRDKEGNERPVLVIP